MTAKKPAPRIRRFDSLPGEAWQFLIYGNPLGFGREIICLQPERDYHPREQGIRVTFAGWTR